MLSANSQYQWYRVRLQAASRMTSRFVSLYILTTLLRKGERWDSNPMPCSAHSSRVKCAPSCHLVFACFLYLLYPSLMAQMVRFLLAMQETQVQPLGWEDPLEKEMAILSSILA